MDRIRLEQVLDVINPMHFVSVVQEIDHCKIALKARAYDIPSNIISLDSLVECVDSRRDEDGNVLIVINVAGDESGAREEVGR